MRKKAHTTNSWKTTKSVNYNIFDDSLHQWNFGNILLLFLNRGWWVLFACFFVCCSAVHQIGFRELRNFSSRDCRFRLVSLLSSSACSLSRSWKIGANVYMKMLKLIRERLTKISSPFSKNKNFHSPGFIFLWIDGIYVAWSFHKRITLWCVKNLLKIRGLLPIGQA